MIDISITSGTFNRISYLQTMIASARASVGILQGVQMEFVIVDGGSTDGTLEWLRQQPDVTLIEHGKLLGAVKAFNDGAKAARGEFVLLANDDIEFIGDGIARAWGMMRAMPDVGMGCFYQDRDRQDQPEEIKWRVEGQMAVVREGNGYRPTHVVYGQVCMVPKALGDQLGWWGDYLHTYGGDNELTSNVYEAGYKVRPVYYGTGNPPSHLPNREHGACIHDFEPKDQLRSMNNVTGTKDPKAVGRRRDGRMHPDSYKWGHKWAVKWKGILGPGRKPMAGPLIETSPRFEVPRKERDVILYLPIFEQGWTVQKEQKRGLREALARVAVVREYDYFGQIAKVGRNGMLQELAQELRTLRPTIVLCQLHGPDPIGPMDIATLRREAPDAWWVNWNGDYWPDALLKDGGIALARAFDLMTSVNRDAVEHYWKLGIPARYWQIGWEPDGRGHEPGPDDMCDVVFLANGYSTERQRLVRRLRGLPYKFILWGNSWTEGWSKGQCLYDFKTACKAYRGAKFSIGDSQWPDSGFVSNRVMQALAAGGSVLCHQYFRGMEELGLVDHETCIVWKDFDELAMKLQRYSREEDARKRIAEAGERLALERHSFDERVRELMEWRPGTESEDWR